MTDHEFVLLDRLSVIRQVYEKYDLENKAYISFSGGKDSTILHYLFDMALPGNRLPRVFMDTGIEYQLIRDFVYKLSKADDRFVILRSKKNIRAVLEEDGYPFKSKEHSYKVWLYKNGGRDYPSIQRYKDGYGLWDCLPILKEQFSDDYPLKISNLCCQRLKKEPFSEYSSTSGRYVTITGMRREEGGYRSKIGCVLTDKIDGSLKKFHPLAVVSEDWENWFVQANSIRLCDLYYPPYNFLRTGCKGCPFNPKLEEDLLNMAVYLPAERKQCELIWKPVYDEYRRLGYRLSKQPTIYD